MSPSRPEHSGRRTVIMVQGKTKSKAPELWNLINKRDRAREVEDSSTAFHPLVGDSSAVSRTHTSAHSGPTNSFEGSTEHHQELAKIMHLTKMASMKIFYMLAQQIES